MSNVHVHGELNVNIETSKVRNARSDESGPGILAQYHAPRDLHPTKVLPCENMTATLHISLQK